MKLTAIPASPAGMEARADDATSPPPRFENAVQI